MPRSAQISPNLISATQHPNVVSAKLQKEVNFRQVVGPYPAPPLANFRCHPVGVIPKKHLSDWRTIYHLSYPQGNSINDHIAKDSYSLTYVRVDDAIQILQSLGKGAHMAKIDLKSAFHLMLLPNSLWFCHFLSSLLSFFIISLRPLFVVIFADIMPTYGKRHREIYYALY